MWGVENGNHKDAAASTKGRFRRVWRIWAALWSGLLLALAHVPSAYAEGQYQPTLAGVVQGPTPYANYGDDEYYDGYLVYGANKYDCLIYALGLNPNDFDLVARGKLSSPSKGGKFYEVVQEGYNDHCPAWVSVPFYEGWLYQSGTTPGTGQNPQYLWAFEIYKDDYEQAKEDAETIRDGGSIDDGGGGSGGGTGSDSVAGTLYANNKDNNNSARVYAYENGTKGELQSYRITANEQEDSYTYVSQMSLVTNDYYDERISTLMGEFDNPTLLVRAYGYSGQSDPQLNIIIGENVALNDAETGFTCDGTYYFLNSFSGERYFGVSGDTYYLVLKPTNMGFSKRNSSSGNLSDSSYCAWVSDVNGSAGGGGGGGGGEDEPDEPSPDPWPEPETPTPKPTNPTVPEPPEPQTPSDPVVPDTPTSPTPIGPNYPDEPPVTLPTIDDDNDFTVDLSGILDAMNEHCIHLQTCMISCTEYMKDVLVDQTYSLSVFLYQLLGSELYTTRTHNSNLAEYIVDNLLQGLHDGLVAVTDNQADLLDYFEDFAEWLDGKLDFKFPSEYDDSSVVYWLKRLYYKNGTGTVSRPDDPVTDPFGIGEWLRNLANLLIQALEGLAPGLVGDLLSTIDLLKLKFPFSLPWDMMAILGAFVASPEAPSIEFPCYAYTASGLEQVGTYDIDMDAYSAVMEGVRFVGYLGFMAYTLSLMPKWAETMCEVVGCA